MHEDCVPLADTDTARQALVIQRKARQDREHEIPTVAGMRAPMKGESTSAAEDEGG